MIELLYLLIATDLGYVYLKGLMMLGLAKLR